MRGYISWKILVVLIIMIPVFSFDSCKKQEKCGCDGDILFSMAAYYDEVDSIYYNLIPTSSISINADTTIMRFQEGYDTYDFCNPVEMREQYRNLNAEANYVRISGDAYWDCNYVSQASQSSYYYYYKYYNIHVTRLKSQLYGK